MADSNLSNDPDLTNSTAFLCGIGTFKPKFLQRFANAKCFLVFFCLIGILQGAYFTYFIGILTTLEKRYSFDSSVTGIILIADNISPALFGIFLGYYGKFAHRPKLVTFGMMITVLSCFLSALPYFLFGSDTKLTILSKNNEAQLCNEYNSLASEHCQRSSQNTLAISILFLANFLNGFGSMAYYAIGTPYMDDNVKKKNSPLYLGATFALRIVGPTLGFMLSSFCLKYYENPSVDPGFNNNDPKWIGAWWIGFIILGLAIFAASFPLAFFPRQLAHTSASNEINCTISKSVCNDLIQSLRKLLKNPILFFHTLSITFQINGLFGYFVFMPRYMESQYRKSAAAANFFSGSVTLVAMVVGVFLGGYCIKKFKPRPRFLVGYMLSIEIFAGIVLFAAIFMGCETTPMQIKPNVIHSLHQKECNYNCSCNTDIFSPICDKNNFVHFSPCSAGCQSFIKENKQKIYQNCSCIIPDDENLKEPEAKSGFCFVDCAMFLPYIIIVSLAKMFSSTSRVGNVLITLSYYSLSSSVRICDR
ncbi:solute carrier organic anion transporter family member 74D isoform X2 [Parasteatoda tepidariorum]|uniref:solute carrier organic anion transporter family member 74D isoform X2 n=1 Tax=Parasteatoda tepidariorum TaxID=114398 RepID=UPI001C71BB5A|nr:solute carrier organic anion transporter family member 74D isoform X2 [Parasteatoda tepidariorum]